MSREIVEAIHEIAKESDLDVNILLDALEDGILAAYKKLPDASRYAFVEMDEEGDYRIFAYTLPADLEERLLEESRERRYEELEALEATSGVRQTVLVEDKDLELAWDQVPEEVITRQDVTPEGFGRIATAAARQVIQSRIRLAERDVVAEEFQKRIGEVIVGIVQQVDSRTGVLVDIGRAEAVLPRSEQIAGEFFSRRDHIRAVIIDVRTETTGPQIVLSRRDPRFISGLFADEVPEIRDGLIEIKAIAREPGYRTKISVVSNSPTVDPVGSCVGQRGARIRPIVSELHGERIDIIPLGDPAKMIARALLPARVREVYVDEEGKEATVVLPEDQKALALGSQGGNVRLASRLLGWKIDVKTDAEFALLRQEEGNDAENTARCAAVLSSGKRCPNAVLEGSHYCGIKAHQLLG